MARNLLEDDQGYPWTASTPFGWIIFACVGSSGILLILLAMYLSIWMFSKGRRRSLIAFLVCVVSIFALESIQGHIGPHISDALASLDVVLFIFSTFLLRQDIKQHYLKHEGWGIEIGPWFTLFFSVIYINYCLNPVRLEHGDELASLNLHTSPSAKIIE